MSSAAAHPPPPKVPGPKMAAFKGNLAWAAGKRTQNRLPRGCACYSGGISVLSHFFLFLHILRIFFEAGLKRLGWQAPHSTRPPPPGVGKQKPLPMAPPHSSGQVRRLAAADRQPPAQRAVLPPGGRPRHVRRRHAGRRHPPVPLRPDAALAGPRQPPPADGCRPSLLTGARHTSAAYNCDCALH